MTSTSRLEKIRARLDLPTVRRASGLLDGRHRSIFTGHGQDFDDQVEYHPGDDVSDIDWKSSARAGIPIIRRFVRESNIATILAVDTGVEMAATSPSGAPKKDVAMFAADVIAYVARARGDLVAMVGGDSERLKQLPARHGTAHLEMLLRTIDDMLSLDSPPGDLTRVMDRVLTWHTRRSLVVLITDVSRPRLEDEDSMRRLRTRHEVMVVRISDALPTDVGIGPTRDVRDEFALPAYLRDDERLNADARNEMQRRIEESTAVLRRRGVEHVAADGEEAVISSLIDLLGRQRRARH